jgi:hypothetical protein
MAWTTEEFELGSRKRKIFLFITFGLVLTHTNITVQWVQKVSFPGGKAAGS